MAVVSIIEKPYFTVIRAETDILRLRLSAYLSKGECLSCVLRQSRQKMDFFIKCDMGICQRQMTKTLSKE